MCTENIFIAGRYNKYLRNLSQSPWIDKDDVRIKHSVQELIEDGLKEFLQFDKSVFSSSGREDVDVRMLGKGRPFVFRILNPWNPSSYNQQNMRKIEEFINQKHINKIKVRNLQVVSKESVAKNLKDGEESKTKEYRALCCCSRPLDNEIFEKLSKFTDLYIDQKTPIRVLHRRSLIVRRRKIYRLSAKRVELGDFESVTVENLNKVFALTLLTEAGTYIKEFVHGDFGRTDPSLSTLIGDCDTDLMELDVMEVNLDWPPDIEESCAPLTTTDRMEESEKSLAELYVHGLEAMQKAENTPRGEARQDLYIKAKRDLEQAMGLTEKLSLFSTNESIDDVATVDLKYMLIPAFLAKITLSSESGPNRLNTFTRALNLHKKFFSRIVEYGLADKSVEQAVMNDELSSNFSSSSLEAAAQLRGEKIEKYKRLKLLESRLDELERRMNDGQEVDDEVAREYYLNLIKKWINEAFESLEREVKPGLYFERNRAECDHQSRVEMPKAAPNKNLPTMTIVKNELQKKVFGLGYPSRPTVTVDEFITKKINDGDLAFHAQKEVYANSLQRYAEQPNLIREQEEASDVEHEEKEERDDVEELNRKRQWDEFKDENPRGSGNRHNMG